MFRSIARKLEKKLKHLRKRLMKLDQTATYGEEDIALLIKKDLETRHKKPIGEVIFSIDKGNSVVTCNVKVTDVPFDVGSVHLNVVDAKKGVVELVTKDNSPVPQVNTPVPLEIKKYPACVESIKDIVEHYVGMEELVISEVDMVRGLYTMTGLDLEDLGGEHVNDLRAKGWMFHPIREIWVYDGAMSK